MSRSYPIWVDVINCNYKNNPGYGFKATGETKIKIGSSAKNSRLFLETVITKRAAKYKNIDVWIFKYSVDDVILKIAVYTDNKGRPGDFWFEKTKLTAIKSLKLKQ